MACACCATGQCCNGATCTNKTKIACGRASGAFTAGGNCDQQYACTSALDACSLKNTCQCAASGGTTRPPTTTCNCDTLTAAGVPNGGCRSYYCEVCSSGACASSCVAPRECCAGTCCPLAQRCVSGACQDKCTSPSVYCDTTVNGTYGYQCCSSPKVCCGPDGCLSAVTNAPFTVDVSVDDWVDTGVTLGASSQLTIHATGSPLWLSGYNGTATPLGVGNSGECWTHNSDSVDASFCHMALIGQLGGTKFFVGETYIGSPGAGRLQLRQNDKSVFDNSGAFVGTISVDPCPGYVPASVGKPIVYAAGTEPVAFGPGTELKYLLGLAGIVASPTCSCNARALQMDAWKEWGCLKRLPEISGWLKEEAEKRGMWFFPPAGVALILAAICMAALKRPSRGNSK